MCSQNIMKGDNVKKKVGRPTEAPRIHQLRIRLSDKEWSMLDSYCKTYNITKTDVIVKGIQLVTENGECNK